MVAGAGIHELLIWLLLMGGVGTLPLGGAPLKLDPTLSAIAPAKCLWYAAYSGQGPADPKSKNQAEQLFAEPQVQRFCQEIHAQIERAVRKAGGPEPEKRALADELPKLVKALLTRPFAVYVEELTKEGDGAKAEAAFVLNAGDQRGDVETAITELIKLVPPGAPEITTMTAAGVTWQRVTTPPGAPPLRFGWKGDYFIVAVGMATPVDLVKRMSGQAPDWLVGLRKEHPIDREITVGYVNVQGILQRVRPIVEMQNPQAWPIVERLGLTSVREVHAVTGYDALASASEAHVVTDGQRSGLLAFLPYKPLAERDLQGIPKDAMFASTFRLDPSEIWTSGVKLAAQFHPHAQEDVDRGLREVESKLGVNVQNDIIGSLGDVWMAYLPGGDVMTSWLNSAGAVRVKDAAKLRQAVAKIVSKANEEMSRNSQNRVTIAQSQLDGQTIYSLQFSGEPVPVSPSWCVSDDWLAFGLLPQSVRSVLQRQAEDSLASVAAVHDVLGSGENGPAAVAYLDTPQLVKSLYPWLQMGLQMAAAPLRQQGIEFDANSLPTQEVIVKHLRPGVSTIAHAQDGFHFSSRQSLPGQGNLAVAAPVGVALLLPAVAKAREAARDAQEINNLRQLALAALNYESARQSFPTDIYSDDGKPLLSWRVRLLPFMEEASLYEKFHLDEPWDSANNQPLIAQMPATLKSPGDNDQANKTRYLALAGDETMFPGKRAVKIASVSDGTSNTLLFVEAAPENAVEWTKPQDIKFSAEKPLAGVASPRGMFLAVFCDGHAQRLSLGIGDETMKAVATRAGGEIVNQVSLEAPPRPDLYRPNVAPAP